MNLCSRLFFTAGLLAAPLAHAGVVMVSDTVGGVAINETPLSGLARTLTVSTPDTYISDISVALDISSLGGSDAWNGDLYAQLLSPSGTLSVLINRPGLSPSDDAGYSHAGFSVTINDSATADIHTYVDTGFSQNGSGQVTGTWKSDGRSDATSSTRPQALSQIFGQNPNGDWTLLVADLASGNRAQLNSWSITITTTPVPEPAATVALSGLALLATAVWLKRR